MQEKKENSMHPEVIHTEKEKKEHLRDRDEKKKITRD